MVGSMTPAAPADWPALRDQLTVGCLWHHEMQEDITGSNESTALEDISSTILDESRLHPHMSESIKLTAMLLSESYSNSTPPFCNSKSVLWTDSP